MKIKKGFGDKFPRYECHKALHTLNTVPWNIVAGKI
jgi:hypothetical protein